MKALFFLLYFSVLKFPMGPSLGAYKHPTSFTFVAYFILLPSFFVVNVPGTSSN